MTTLATNPNLEYERQILRNATARYREAMVQFRQATEEHYYKPAETIPQKQLDDGRLYQDRFHFFSMLPREAIVLEVGTWAGRYASRLWNECKPKELHVMDLTFERFDRSLFRGYDESRIYLHEGNSHVEMRALPPAYFDFVYVDGDHSYPGAKQDITEAVRLTKPGGIIGINDYTLWCANLAMEFGVLYATNEVVVEHELSLIGFALEPYGQHDVYLRR
jgi:predicted O-methyltransferase YrrM